MKQHTDSIGGFLATVAVFVADHFNQLLGTTIGVVSLVIMLLRLRREWRHRDE